MVDNCITTERRLAARDHDEIRYLLYCGLSVEEVADRLGATYEATRYRVRQYGLNGPVTNLDAVRLELSSAFRDTNRRLEASDLTATDHARLCATQIKQAMALLRTLPTENFLEDEEMSRKSEAARQRLLAMSDEDALNELRRVAGLENKSAEPDEVINEGSGEPLIDASVSDEGDASAETASGEELADMDVYGRARCGQNAGGG